MDRSKNELEWLDHLYTAEVRMSARVMNRLTELEMFRRLTIEQAMEQLPFLLTPPRRLPKR